MSFKFQCMVIRESKYASQLFLKQGSQIRNQFKISKKYFSSNKFIVKSPYPDVSLPTVPLHHYIWKNIDKWPNHIAIECGVSGKKYRYLELYNKCKRLGYNLQKLGLKKGDTIAIILPNLPEFPIAYLGALECGLIASTVNPCYTKDEVLFQLKDCKAKWIICHPINLKLILEVKKIYPDLKIICTHNIDGTCPEVNGDIILLEHLVTGNNDELVNKSNIHLDEVALIAYSSGTTGLPKGACLTHRTMAANLAQLSQEDVSKFKETNENHQDVVVGVLPFFHCYGNSVVLLQGLLKGSKLITLPKFDPKLFIEILANNKNVLVFVVPPIIFFLGNSNEVSSKHLEGVREIMNGAAPCSAHDIEKIKQKTNGNVLFSQGYGMTEASPVLTLYYPTGDDKDNMSTIGKLLPNTCGKVISIENGQSLPPNTSGELCFKGPQVMKGYLNNKKATSEAIDSERWLHTGDIGYYDTEGYFYITDRIKELIKVKGFQVAPAELEEVIRRFPGVLEVGVVGAPSERTGETPVAFVQTLGNSKISEEDIKSFVASQLSSHKHISSVRFISSIPKTASGKILRRELKKML